MSSSCPLHSSTPSSSKHPLDVHTHFEEHHHGHEHGHHHIHGNAPKTLYIAFSITALFCVFEFIGAFYANSLALFSDASHMVSDAAMLLLAALSAHFALKKPTERFSFGFHKAEALLGFFSAISIYVVAAGILFFSIQRLIQPQQVIHGPTVIGLALLGLLINVIVAFLLLQNQKKQDNSFAIRSALLHVTADALGSISALIAGLGIYFFNALWLDPMVCLFIVVLLSLAAKPLLIQSVSHLLNATPPQVNTQTLTVALLKQFPQIHHISHIHIWTLTADHIALTAHIHTHCDTVQSLDTLLQQVHQWLSSQHQITHCTLQPVLSNIEFS